MIRISLSNRNTKILITLSGSVLLGFAVLILLNLSASLSKEDAEKRVRSLLSREATQRCMAALESRNSGESDFDTAAQLKQELDRIDNMKFVSVDVRRLIPDILLSPLRPSHVVRVVLLDRNQQSPPRYFLLPYAYIDKESSKILWLFSI